MTREQEVERRALAKRDGADFELFRARYLRESRRIMHEIFGEPLTPEGGKSHE